MSIISCRKSLAAVVTIIIIARTLYFHYAWRKKKREDKPKAINEVIVFSENKRWVPSAYSPVRSTVPPGLDRILFYLNRPRRTLDICMYNFNNPDIGRTLQKLHHMKVKIRCIGEISKAYVNGSEARRLNKLNVISLRLKMLDDNQIMHHKFCLIDASADNEDSKVKPFLMTGSLNWTNSVLLNNYESVIVTSNPKLVQEYRKAFEALWCDFKPVISSPVHTADKIR